ncbi:MAG: cytochrome c oxidase subunit 3 [Chitinophagaceae bacterium]|nr:cytochrome c oxidase subunit 3 [Chitinophagaceae bacterium]
MEINYKSIYYPPGGILIWIVIYLELITFGAAMVALGYYGMAERAQFHSDSQSLNKTIAAVNTVFLLTSGFFVAMAVHFFKLNMINKTAQQLLWAILFGFGFLLLKLVEYHDKLEAGFTMEKSSFFMFYWLLTGFHWIHVLVGAVILIITRRSVLKKRDKAVPEDIEAGAAFWHMCDLIWLLLFPVLYLLF